MFTKEIDLPGLVEHQTQDPNWGGKFLKKYSSVFLICYASKVSKGAFVTYCDSSCFS